MKKKSALPLRINNGFTLVEIMVVIGIIAILTAALLSMLNPAKQFARARNSQRRADISTIATALEQYYADNNEYPESDTIDTLGTLLTGTSGTTDVYLKVMPKDPKSPTMNYCYNNNPDELSTNNYQNFLLCAELEGADKDEIPEYYVSKKGSLKCISDSNKYYYCVMSQ